MARHGSLLEQFPEKPKPYTDDYRRWSALYETARTMVEDVLREAIRRGRLDKWDAVCILETIFQSPQRIWDPWPDTVRAVEKIRELAKLEGIDRELSKVGRS
jgi:hypothetical protein